MRLVRTGRTAWGTLLLGLLVAVTAVAAEPFPAVALIIDDLGDRARDGYRAVALPGAVTYSFLPRTPYARRLAQMAHERDKEVMLHQPMEALRGNRLGPGGLTLHMTREEFVQTLRENLRSVPHVAGINNHMGSLLTRHPGHMNWLMQEVAALGGLYFVDSRTTDGSVARTVAFAHSVPNARRDVFLDNRRERAAIMGQLAKLIAKAQRDGAALGIGHPYPETLDVLEAVLPQLPSWGIRLVPLSEYITLNQERSWKLWQASLSPSPKDARNSKPLP